MKLSKEGLRFVLPWRIYKTFWKWTQDTSLAVRKRVIKILAFAYSNISDHSIKVDAVCKLLSRIADEDTSVNVRWFLRVASPTHALQTLVQRSLRDILFGDDTCVDLLKTTALVLAAAINIQSEAVQMFLQGVSWAHIPYVLISTHTQTYRDQQESASSTQWLIKLCEYALLDITVEHKVRTSALLQLRSWNPCAIESVGKFQADCLLDLVWTSLAHCNASQGNSTSSARS